MALIISMQQKIHLPMPLLSGIYLALLRVFISCRSRNGLLYYSELDIDPSTFGLVLPKTMLTLEEE